MMRPKCISPIPLLILEAGLKDGRDYWLKNLVSSGYELYLAQPWQPSWEKPYIKDYFPISFEKWHVADLARLTAYCRDRGIQGVLCLNEGTVPFANELNRTLGFPLLCEGDATIFRNKAKMRDAARGANILQPRSCRISRGESFNERLHQVAQELGFPLIVKPIEFMSSLGVKLVHSEQELFEGALLAARVDLSGEDLRAHYGFNNDIIVEEFIRGKEYSVESVVQNGEVLHSAITQKFKCAAPYFDEVGHISAPVIGEGWMAKITKAVKSLHQAMGVKNAITHTEVLLSQGEVFLVEMGLRPGGDYIPWLQSISSGFPFWNVAARLAKGNPVNDLLSPVPYTLSAAVFFPFATESGTPPEPDRVREIFKETGVEILSWDYSPKADQFSVNPGLATTRLGTILFASNDYYKCLATFKMLSWIFSGMESGG